MRMSSRAAKVRTTKCERGEGLSIPAWRCLLAPLIRASLLRTQARVFASFEEAVRQYRASRLSDAYGKFMALANNGTQTQLISRCSAGLAADLAVLTPDLLELPTQPLPHA